MERQVFTRAEVAEILGVSLPLIDKLIRSNRLACLDVGRRRLIPSAALAAFLESASAASQRRDALD